MPSLPTVFKRLLFIGLAALLAPTAHAHEVVYLEAVSCSQGPFKLRLPSDARRLETLGQVIREDVAEVEQHDGYTATRKTLFFDGLELGVVLFSNDPARLMVTRAELSSPKWNRISPFKLNQPVELARRRLGRSASDDPDLRKSYGGDADSVRVHSMRGQVTRVSYNCYSG